MRQWNSMDHLLSVPKEGEASHGNSEIGHIHAMLQVFLLPKFRTTAPHGPGWVLTGTQKQLDLWKYSARPHVEFDLGGEGIPGPRMIVEIRSCNGSCNASRLVSSELKEGNIGCCRWESNNKSNQRVFVKAPRVTLRRVLAMHGDRRTPS